MCACVVQPRDTCYVASPGLPELIYSGYKPHAYSWDDYPPLKLLLEAVSFDYFLCLVFLLVAYSMMGPDIIHLNMKVHKALPGSNFNSLLLNRYKGGNDYVGWHSDDEKLYGLTPEIASVSFGCDRDFLLKKKARKTSQGMNSHWYLDWFCSWLLHCVVPRVSTCNWYTDSPIVTHTSALTCISFYIFYDIRNKIICTVCQFFNGVFVMISEKRNNEEPVTKRLKKSSHVDQHSFALKHGSLLVMRGYTQRDWVHSVPKRAKAEATRINLTFRHVL